MPNSESQATQRSLTDADIEALLEAAEYRFYRNLGKGFWDVLWKAIIVLLVGLAAWGSYHK